MVVKLRSLLVEDLLHFWRLSISKLGNHLRLSSRARNGTKNGRIVSCSKAYLSQTNPSCVPMDLTMKIPNFLESLSYLKWQGGSTRRRALYACREETRTVIHPC